jgi:hypothetical protein
VLFGSCLVLGSWSEQSRKNAELYNQRFTEAHARYDQERGALMESLDQHRFDPVPPLGEMAGLRRKCDQLQQTIQAIGNEMSGWPLPWGGGSLHRGYKQYLEHAEENLPRFSRAVAIVGDPTLSADQRRDQAGAILDEVDADEKVRFEELQRLQHEFAHFFGYTLMPAPHPPARIIMTPEIRKMLDLNKRP